MLLWKRAAGLGLLSWFIPFAIGFVAFPLKRTNPSLFETTMSLVVVCTAGVMLQLYFRRRRVGVAEAVLVGAMWLIFNLVLDYPMFAYGPMKMTAGQYYSSIGLEYLVFPLVGFAAGKLAQTTYRQEA